MSSAKHAKVIGLERLAVIIRRDLKSRDILTVLRAVHENRSRSSLFVNKDADDVFAVLFVLGKSELRVAETTLLKLTTAPELGGEITTTHVLWSQILQLITELGAQYSEEFVVQMLKKCLTSATDMAFALGHSTVVARLSERYPSALNSSTIARVISCAEDSRSIYALKLASQLDWSIIKPFALKAMLSNSRSKQIEAMWLVNERGTPAEVLSFAEEEGIKVPASVIESEDIRMVTRFILTAAHGEAFCGIAYAIRMGGPPLSLEELRHVAKRIRSDLEAGGR